MKSDYLKRLYGIGTVPVQTYCDQAEFVVECHLHRLTPQSNRSMLA
jgi:hypothetical protein